MLLVLLGNISCSCVMGLIVSFLNGDKNLEGLDRVDPVLRRGLE